jgi:RNA polymerase sigma-70 factor (ECF subfamily)
MIQNPLKIKGGSIAKIHPGTLTASSIIDLHPAAARRFRVVGRLFPTPRLQELTSGAKKREPDPGGAASNRSSGRQPARLTDREHRLSAEEDRADVRRVKAGDADAFEGIVRRWQKPLLNLAYRFRRERGEAEEMVQDAFLRIYRKLDLYREDSAFSTWMFTVATRRFTSHVRRKYPRWVQVEDLEGFDRLTAGRLNVGRPTAGADREEAVRRAVGTLPDRYRDAIVLFYFLERDVAESSKVLGISTGTFKSRLHRAREMLRKKVGGLLPAQPAPEEA